MRKWRIQMLVRDVERRRQTGGTVGEKITERVREG